jgi:dTDP-glucose pyrophosphorylase
VFADKHSELKKAVILARGLGKRMRARDATAPIASEQRQAADAGLKAMIPLGEVGRVFLDYVLSALADAGVYRICLVIGPEHRLIREYYRSLPLHRIEIDFAVQVEPLGTANAVLAAEAFAADEPFLVLNSDNYYPVEVFRALRELRQPGAAAFERESLIREGNIPSERIRRYALLEIDAAGYVAKIAEKPGEIAESAAEREVFVSMNCWRFDAAIFRACELVPHSLRGEFELPEAVQYGLDTLGMRIKAVPFRAGVLDLTHRSDISGVARRLAGIKVEL